MLTTSIRIHANLHDRPELALSSIGVPTAAELGDVFFAVKSTKNPRRTKEEGERHTERWNILWTTLPGACILRNHQFSISSRAPWMTSSHIATAMTQLSRKHARTWTSRWDANSSSSRPQTPIKTRPKPDRPARPRVGPKLPQTGLWFLEFRGLWFLEFRGLWFLEFRV